MLSSIMTQLEIPVLAFRGESFWAEIDRARTTSLWWSGKAAASEIPKSCKVTPTESLRAFNT